MPITPDRRDAIAAAVATYDAANPLAPLPDSAARLLIVMFPTGDVCHRNQDSLMAEGFTRRTLTRLLRILIETDLVSKERGAGRAPDTYRLHLPPVRR